jgi:hypothetical protein
MAHRCLQEKKRHYSPISSVIPTISSAGYHQHILLARENGCRENGTVQLSVEAKLQHIVAEWGRNNKPDQSGSQLRVII